MSATKAYIDVLMDLKAGDLGLLRTHAGKGLDETVDGFDLFAGIWWPLRQKSERAPKRGVAWLIAKLYAYHPIPHSECETLAGQLRRCQPREERAGDRFRQKFDRLLAQPIETIETDLQWAIDSVASNGLSIDWVKLTDDLSAWDKEKTRINWAKDYLETKERT